MIEWLRDKLGVISRVEKTCGTCNRARPASEVFCPYCTAPPPFSPPRKRSSSSTVDTSLEMRWGGGGENPTVDEMREALAELDVTDVEHPDTWLSDEDGWTVSVDEDGMVVFSNEAGDICKREGISQEEALELWQLLQQGKREEIRQRLSV